jgi:triacylglycerol lipase
MDTQGIDPTNSDLIEMRIEGDSERTIVRDIFKDVADVTINWSEGTSFQYTTHFKRFESTKYNPENAGALDEMCFAVSQANSSGNRNLNPPPGFNKAIPIIGVNPISQEEEIIAYIFVSCKMDVVALVFTGTETLAELISDFDFIQVRPTQLSNFRQGMLVERGFYRIYLSVQSAIQEVLAELIGRRTQFVVTGHSLGGALATLGSFDLTAYCPFVYTFASPRVGNPIFAQGYNHLLHPVWRVDNSSDIVPDVPLPAFLVLIYEHVGNPVVFTLNLGTILNNHIEAYRRVIIEQQPPDNPNGVCPLRFDCSSKKCPHAECSKK